MKKPWKATLAATLGVTLALNGLTGCAASPEAGDAQAEDGIVVDVDGMDREYTSRDKDPSYDQADATTIALADGGAAVDGPGAQAEGTVVTVTEPGTYVVTGSAAQGQLVVDLPGEEDKAQVVLAGMSLHNATGPALYVKSADKVFVTLAEGTSNALSDGDAYELEEGSDEPYATLFSKDDLTINGVGSLTVTASYRHGICSKDDLVVTGGTIAVDAPEDALRGRDCVKVAAGTFDLTAGEDAVKSNRDDDPVRGFVSLDGGTFAISAGDDAVHGETAVFAGDAQVTVAQCYEGYEAQWVYITGGEHRITASDDALNASAISTSADEAAADGADAAGAEAPEPPQGAMTEGTATEGEPPALPEEAEGGQAPPDGELPEDGTMPEPPTLPEGFEGGQAPETQGNDNGDGEGDGAAQGRGGMGMGKGGAMAAACEDCLISIEGGTVVLDAQGDAVDSNGSISITGGTLYATGPSTAADAALDYELEAAISGGTVIMCGPAGMAETFTGGSQPFALVQAQGSAGGTVEVATASGEVLASFAPTRAFQAVNVSVPGLEEGQEYQLIVNGTATSFTASTTPSQPDDPSDGFGGKGPQGSDGPPDDAAVNRGNGGQGGRDLRGKAPQEGAQAA